MTIVAEPGYLGTVFGELRVPYFDLHTDVNNSYSERDVIFNEMPGTFEIPDLKVRAFRDRLLEKERENAAKKGKEFVDVIKARLVGYSINKDNHILYLTLQKANFSSHLATNLSLTNPEVMRMLKERGDNYRNLDDGLANITGTNTCLLSIPDNAILLTKRSEELRQYPGLRGVAPAGFTIPPRDGFNLFNTVKNEAEQEVGIEIDKPRISSLGRALDDRHSQVLFMAETSYTGKQILSAPKSGKWEHRKLMMVDFEPIEVMKHLTITVKEEPEGVPKGTGVWIPDKTPEWDPAHWMATNAMLIKKYGFDEVWNAYQEVWSKKH